MYTHPEALCFGVYNFVRQALVQFLLFCYNEKKRGEDHEASF